MRSGLFLILVAFPSAAAAQVLAGGEFQVNIVTTAAQARPSIAVRPNGDFVVVFEGDGADGSYQGIVGRRFDATGAALGGEFQVNTSTTDNQYSPSVAADTKGNFVVVWTGPDQSANGVFGQRFDAGGVRRGNEFQVNTYTTGTQGLLGGPARFSPARPTAASSWPGPTRPATTDRVPARTRGATTPRERRRATSSASTSTRPATRS